MLYPPITREAFERCRHDGPAHRICFARAHGNQPKHTDRYGGVGVLGLPFAHGIADLLKVGCRLQQPPRFNENGSPWWRIGTEEEFRTIHAWARAQGTRVFLRDCLDQSVALDVNLLGGEHGPDGHTVTGDLERRAKLNGDPDAIAQLVGAMCATVRDLPYFKAARHVAGVPAPPGKPRHLPAILADGIARTLGIRNLTDLFAFDGPKDSIKALPVGQKWAAWERSGLQLTEQLKWRPAVLLVDDKYQSGTTLNFVASRLREAGAGSIYGLCAVKTWRDTDNG